MVSGKPRLTHHSIPGEIRSVTLSIFCAVIWSPGATSACAAVPDSVSAKVIAPAPIPHERSLVVMVLPPSNGSCHFCSTHTVWEGQTDEDRSSHAVVIQVSWWG